MDNEKLVSVTFTGSASPYHKGDVAGFPAAEAKAYVDKQVARYSDASGASAAEGGGLASLAQGQAPGATRTRKPKATSAPKDLNPTGGELVGAGDGQQDQLPDDEDVGVDESDQNMSDAVQQDPGQDGDAGQAPAGQE